jgi:hypothetical protein
MVAKHLMAAAQTRRALETPEGPQDDAILDVDLLREFDMMDIADKLNGELGTGKESQQATEPDTAAAGDSESGGDDDHTIGE